MTTTGASKNHNPSSDSTVGWAVISAITLFGLLLRLIGLSNRGFWADELNLWYSCFNAYRATGTGPLPPILYGFVMRIAQNSDSLTFRLPSLFFGTLFIPLMALLVQALADRRAAILAAFLTALSPSAILFSQEARPYAVMYVLCVLTYLGFVKGYIEGDERYGALYLAALVVGFLNHALTSHVAAGLGLFMLIEASVARYKDMRKNAYVVLTGLTFVALIWLRNRWEPLQDLGGLYVRPFYTFVRMTLYCLGPTVQQSFTPHSLLFDILGLAFFAAVVVGWNALWKTTPRIAWAFLTLFCLSLVVLFFSLGQRAHWTWGRYLSQLLPVYIAMAAIGLTRPATEGWHTARALLIAVVLLVPGVGKWKQMEVFNRSAGTFIPNARILAENQSKLTGSILLFSLNSDPRWDIAGMAIYRRDTLPFYFTGATGELRRVTPFQWYGNFPQIPPIESPLTEPIPAGDYALLTTSQGRGFVADCSKLAQTPAITSCEPADSLINGKFEVAVVRLNHPSASR